VLFSKVIYLYIHTYIATELKAMILLSALLVEMVNISSHNSHVTRTSQIKIYNNLTKYCQSNALGAQVGTTPYCLYQYCIVITEVEKKCSLKFCVLIGMIKYCWLLSKVLNNYHSHLFRCQNFDFHHDD